MKKRNLNFNTAMKNFRFQFYLLLLFSTIFAMSTNAQDRLPDGPVRKKVQAAKIAFYTQKINLTPEEAKVFWPLYDQYQDAIQGQITDRLQDKDELNNRLVNLTNAQINQLIDNRLAQAEIAYTARKNFITKLRAELSPLKVALFFRAEEQFRRELLERAEQLRNDNPSLNRRSRNR